MAWTSVFFAISAGVAVAGALAWLMISPGNRIHREEDEQVIA